MLQIYQVSRDCFFPELLDGYQSSKLKTLRRPYIHSRQRFVLILNNLLVIYALLPTLQCQRSYTRITNYDFFFDFFFYNFIISKLNNKYWVLLISFWPLIFLLLCLSPEYLAEKFLIQLFILLLLLTWPSREKKIQHGQYIIDILVKEIYANIRILKTMVLEISTHLILMFKTPNFWLSHCKASGVWFVLERCTWSIYKLIPIMQ